MAAVLIGPYHQNNTNKATGSTHLRTKHTIVFVTHIDVVDELRVEPK
jgi:hypothetical protein